MIPVRIFISQRNVQASGKESNGLSFWTHPGNTLWYCYAAMIWESVTRDTRSSDAWALRWKKSCPIEVHPK